MTARGFCLSCGRAGDVQGMALDGVHPLVLCRWWEKGDPKPHGHGLRIGTLSQVESDVRQGELRRARLQAQHVRGAHDAQVNRKCPECQDGRGGRAQGVIGV